MVTAPPGAVDVSIVHRLTSVLLTVTDGAVASLVPPTAAMKTVLVGPIVALIPNRSPVPRINCAVFVVQVPSTLVMVLNALVLDFAPDAAAHVRFSVMVSSLILVPVSFRLPLVLVFMVAMIFRHTSGWATNLELDAPELVNTK